MAMHLSKTPPKSNAHVELDAECAILNQTMLTKRYCIAERRTNWRWKNQRR